MSSDGQYIAVLQEFALEVSLDQIVLDLLALISLIKVWSSREQYNTLVGRRPVEKDPAPQWRR